MIAHTVTPPKPADAEPVPPFPFVAERLGVIMTPSGDANEAWGVLNPAGVRAADGVMHLFPRIVAEGNFSRIGHVRVRFDRNAPIGVERIGLALEPREQYEVGPAGGGVEDPRACYIAALGTYVMTYTAFVPFEPRVAIAVSNDLVTWRRLGLVRYALQAGVPDLNACGNKDATMFPDVVLDPDGVPSLAILHRPTTRIAFHHDGCDLSTPPCGEETKENVWISYVPLADAQADVSALTAIAKHETVMAPAQPWEDHKVGAGAPPVRLPYGWLLLYHAVSTPGGHPRYAMGAVILDPLRPSRVLYRTPAPILEPSAGYERSGTVADVVFPTATDLRADGKLDVYYGAADRVIAVARFTIPVSLPRPKR